LSSPSSSCFPRGKDFFPSVQVVLRKFYFFFLDKLFFFWLFPDFSPSKNIQVAVFSVPLLTTLDGEFHCRDQRPTCPHPLFSSSSRIIIKLPGQTRLAFFRIAAPLLLPTPFFPIKIFPDTVPIAIFLPFSRGGFLFFFFPLSLFHTLVTPKVFVVRWCTLWCWWFPPVFLGLFPVESRFPPLAGHAICFSPTRLSLFVPFCLFFFPIVWFRALFELFHDFSWRCAMSPPPSWCCGAFPSSGGLPPVFPSPPHPTRPLPPHGDFPLTHGYHRRPLTWGATLLFSCPQ